MVDDIYVVYFPIYIPLSGEHMDNLVELGQGEIKGWHTHAAKFIQEHHMAITFNNEKGCLAADLKSV